MIKLSKKVEYALVALLHLDFVEGDKLVSTKEISETYGMPEEHLGKVLQKLAKQGLLVSVKGAHGGYRLSRPLTAIKLGQVAEGLEGKMVKAHEGEDHTLCTEFCTCYVRGAVEEVQMNLMNYMNEVSLADILRTKMEEQKVG